MKIPRAGATLAIGDAEITTALEMFEGIQAGHCDAPHLLDAEIHARGNAVDIRLPAVGVTVRLHVHGVRDPWLERSLPREAITRGSISFYDVAQLERYIAEMERPAQQVAQQAQPAQQARPLRASDILLGIAA